MDLLELLESRVDSLVTEIDLLRRENAKLRKDAVAGDGTALQAENSNLKRALAGEQQSKAALSKRIEGILARTNGLVQDQH
jgi:regulator of replication initiation timing